MGLDAQFNACDFTIPIHTLAAAYAESGNFEEAIKRQQQAIDLLDKDADKTPYEKRLELYKNSKPYRQSPREIGRRREDTGVGYPRSGP